MNTALPPEISAVSDILPLWANAGERPYCKRRAAQPWSVFGPDRIASYIHAASDRPEGEPTLHFFSSEKPVRDVEALRSTIKLSSWKSLDDLDELLRRSGFIGTVRVTQLHNLDAAVEDLIATCLTLLEAEDRRRIGRASPTNRTETLHRFFHHHGGVNAYFSMKDSDRAIPFHRDPGDVFAFQASGGKLWELGSSTTLYGGSYSDHDEDGCLQIATMPNEMLFLPRGIRHRAKVLDGMMSLHYVLMVDTAPEYWVLSGLAEALKDLPLFNGLRPA